MTAQIRRNVARWIVAGTLFACLAWPQSAQAEDWADYLNQGQDLAKEGKYREAIASCKKAIELGSGEPEIYKAYSNLGVNVNKSPALRPVVG